MYFYIAMLYLNRPISGALGFLPFMYTLYIFIQCICPVPYIRYVINYVSDTYMCTRLAVSTQLYEYD